MVLKQRWQRSRTLGRLWNTKPVLPSLPRRSSVTLQPAHPPLWPSRISDDALLFAPAWSHASNDHANCGSASNTTASAPSSHLPRHCPEPPFSRKIDRCLYLQDDSTIFLQSVRLSPRPRHGPRCIPSQPRLCSKRSNRSVVLTRTGNQIPIEPVPDGDHHLSSH